LFVNRRKLGQRERLEGLRGERIKCKRIHVRPVTITSSRGKRQQWD